MGAFIRTEKTTYAGKQFQSSKGYIVQDTWAAPAAASSTSVHAAITTAVVVTTGITSPDFPRVARIVSGGSGHVATGNVVITGTDARGNTVTDTITLNSNTAVDGVVAFNTITSIDCSGVSAMDANDTVTVGCGTALGLSRKLAGAVDAGIMGSADAVYEATRPTFVAHATFSKNTVAFNTAPNGAKNFTATFVSKEYTTAA